MISSLADAFIRFGILYLFYLCLCNGLNETLILYFIYRYWQSALNYLCSRMVYLTRIEHFNAAHKLYNPQWSREKNEDVFGVCANENWHGHNFNLYVTVRGAADADTGFLIDAKKLSQLINEHVIEKLDHKNLNLDVDFLKDKMCTTENLAVAIWRQLSVHITGNAKLHCIKLYETPKIYVEYFGE